MKKFISLLSIMTVLILSSVYGSNIQDAVQSKAIKRLEAASKEAIKIELDQRTNIPRFVNLRVPVSGPLTAEAASLRFFEEYKELFKMSNPAEELTVKNILKDRLGMTYVTMHQSVSGIPVFGREIVVHINSNHEIFAVNGEFFPGVKVEGTVPSVSPDLAITAAKSDIGPAVYRWDTVFEQMLPAGKSWTPTAELMIYEHEKQFRLVYRIMIAIEEPESANWVYFVDSKTGEVLYRYNDLKATDAVGTGYSLYRGPAPVSINTNQTSATNFEMKDNLRILWTYDNNNRGDQSLPGTLFTDSDNVWGNGTNSNRQSAGVDAHWGAAVTYDYYSSNHDRQSVDDNGLRITSSVHYKRNLVNAYWNGAQMLYGDGDGVTATPLVDLDVVAHELTHGVTQYSANLIYQNQSGALNESVSDVFAMLIDTDDYTIGEDSWTPGTAGDALRSMEDPSSEGQPEHMEDYVNTTADNGGVHTNSGIPNFAAYLATAGGSGKYPTPVVAGIGRAKVGNIWYLALTGGYMTASTDFAGARTATVAAATAIYGASSSEVQTVKNAWTAVGVNEPPPPPTDFTGTFVAHSYSTPHPYRNRRTYTHTITHTGAIGMKVSFQNFATEESFDFVYIKDGSGTTVWTYHGSLGNFVSGPVNGETITVQLVTDQLVTDYGFDINGYYWNAPPSASPGITGLSDATPEKYALEQNYPNPFNPTTSISYQLPEVAKVSLKIYDISGQLVKTLVDEEQSADSYTISWDATNKAGSKVTSGIYFYELRAGNFTQTRRMVLLR